MRTCLHAALVLATSPFLTAAPFDERIAANDAVRHWSFPAQDLLTVGKVREVSGPPSHYYPAFAENAKAVQFEPGAYLRDPSAGADPAFQFTNGDTITLEAWVRCDEIPNGDNHYIIGKGRTHRKGFDPDNQNWALRLRGEGGAAKLSFLFRSRANADAPGAYHRWTSHRGLAPGKRWHHLAVTYTFGTPKSIQAWIDGRSTDGKWDLGKATTRPPVVDDDDVWIGSSLGGAQGNTLRGAIASIALYRHKVDGFETAYAVNKDPRPIDATKLPVDAVLIEIFRADSGPKDWPIHLDDPLRTVSAPAFGFFRVPPHYGPSGERRDHRGNYLARLAAEVSLPPGEHELLLRSPGKSRLIVDGEEIASLASPKVGSDGHGPLRARPTLPYPRPRLGTQDTTVTYQSDGKPVLVVLEVLLGVKNGKIQASDVILASRSTPSSTWSLVAPTARVPFTAGSLERYKQAERDSQNRLNASLRRELAARTADYWDARHTAARTFLQSLPALALPGGPAEDPHTTAIDRFLHAKIANARRRASAGNQSEFAQTIHPLLEKHCFRCHGKKRKGGLRLDSRAAALKGGESGTVFTPGDTENSELLRRIRSTDVDERMPPKGERLAASDVTALTAWIESGAPWEEPAATVGIPSALDEHALLRRVYLDTVGVFPTPADVESYLADSAPDKFARLVDTLLADPRHADHWVSYWQDLLAENPRLVKPMLNNTGPFRWWIHESLLDHKPFDRFVTELVTFAGGLYAGGAGGFKLATQNDVPMAAKAHVIGTAFLGMEMQCARCHDAPFHSLRQAELFSTAALLKGGPLKVPSTSSVPSEFFERISDRETRIVVTLNPDTPVEPSWPFPDLAPILESDPQFDSPAERLAYQITRPENRRFARVIVNRLWKRYFGQGFVEPAGDWEGNEASHPELLDFLAREFASHNYDLRHISRLILNSAAYRRAPRATAVTSPAARFFEAPLRRRLTAEQLVDSLFAATGTPVFSEELTLDVEGWRTDKDFLNLGRPRRAWEFVSLSTERDRPSLTLPNAQAIVSFLEAYGWRSNRAEPLTDRHVEPGVLQAGMLANGLVGTWWTRLSDYSDLTGLAVSASSPNALIDQLYLRLLTRQPTRAERESLLAVLAPEFDSRLTTSDATFTKKTYATPVRDISWRNHLDAEANQLAAEIEAEAEQGPPPTDLLTPGWRERFEDAIWSVINSPEIQFVP